MSPDGSLVYSGGSGDRVECWDAGDMERVTEFSGHEGDVFDLAVAPSGDHVISASDDSTLLMWKRP